MNCSINAIVKIEIEGTQMIINSIQQYFNLKDPLSVEALAAFQKFCFEATEEESQQQRQELGAIDALTDDKPSSNNLDYLVGFHRIKKLNSI